jgi:hypothetical protein
VSEYHRDVEGAGWRELYRLSYTGRYISLAAETAKKGGHGTKPRKKRDQKNFFFVAELKFSRPFDIPRTGNNYEVKGEDECMQVRYSKVVHR